jgi:hypothetical protein
MPLTSRQQQATAVIYQKYEETKKYNKISKKELRSMVMQNLKNRPELEQYKSMLNQELMPYRSKYDQFKYLPQSADSIKQQIKDTDLDSAELWQQLDEFIESEAMKANYYEAFMKEQGQLAKLQSNPQANASGKPTIHATK